VKEGESIESAVRRFKKRHKKASLLSELRKREHPEDPNAKRTRKSLGAKKRHLRDVVRSGY